MIKCKDICFSFNQSSLFNHLNLEIRKGEFVSIRGQSGKGKSTLLKMIQGYVIPYSGVIEIEGLSLNIRNIQEIRNRICWIPQNINLPVARAYELIDFLGIEKNSDRINGYVERLGLKTEILKKPFSKISGGQKQRIVIALGLSLQKPIVLLDEPTAHLDDYSIDKLIDVIIEEPGRTILSVSHNHTWLKASDRVFDIGTLVAKETYSII